MAKLVIVLVSFFACSAYAAPSVRIVNGTDAREGEFPFAVSLRNNLRHTCGATILNKRHALTAAHCVCNNDIPNNPSTYSIQYGSVRISETTERSIPVSQIICNKFSESTLENDVAVLKLTRDLPDDGTWQSVRLAANYDTTSGGTGVVIGWGRLWANGPIPQILQKLTVDIYSDFICNLRFDATQHVCFGASLGGACNGDSGTALMTVDNEQIAVASFITNTCGTATMLTPNVYARVRHFVQWIEDNSRL